MAAGTYVVWFLHGARGALWFRTAGNLYRGAELASGVSSIDHFLHSLPGLTETFLVRLHLFTFFYGVGSHCVSFIAGSV